MSGERYGWLRRILTSPTHKPSQSSEPHTRVPMVGLDEVRCECGRLLFRMSADAFSVDGAIEVKCPKCGAFKILEVS